MSNKKPIVFRWIIALCTIVLLEYCFEYLLFNRFNQSPLSLETIEGTGQAYHPSVLFFNEPWHGYQYWMAETPYPMNTPPYRDRWECPSIHVSPDGVHWKTPEGLTNPIDDLLPTEIENRDFFSDPHLVFKEGQLECFYRYSKKTEEGYQTSLVRKTSQDGIRWNNRELLLDFFESSCLATVGDMVRSPAILWQDDRYRMWFVDNVDPKGVKQVCYSESPDGLSWSLSQTCTLTGKTISPWHIDLAFLDGEYVLTIYDFQDLTLWKSDDGLTFSFCQTILSPSGVSGSFYSDGLYRSSLIKTSEGYKMYFSAFDNRQTRIGLLTGTRLDSLHILSVNGPYRSFRGFFQPFLTIWKVRLWRLLHGIQ